MLLLWIIANAAGKIIFQAFLTNTHLRKSFQVQRGNKMGSEYQTKQDPIFKG
jgi:hypothetical protein